MNDIEAQEYEVPTWSIPIDQDDSDIDYHQVERPLGHGEADNNDEPNVYTTLQPSTQLPVQVYSNEGCNIIPKKNMSGTNNMDSFPTKSGGKTLRIVLCVLGTLGAILLTVLVATLAIIALAVAIPESSTSTTDANMSPDMTQNLNSSQELSSLMKAVKDLNSRLEGTVQLRNCNTSIEATCLVPARLISQCTTNEVEYRRKGELVTDFNCLIERSGGETNTVVVTAEMRENAIRCNCAYSSILNGNNALRSSIRCRLQITRCEMN